MQHQFFRKCQEQITYSTHRRQVSAIFFLAISEDSRDHEGKSTGGKKLHKKDRRTLRHDHRRRKN